MTVFGVARFLLSAAVCGALATAVQADEGMWTFDAFPSAQVRAAHGFAPDQAWLDHVRLSAARLTGGCSSSLVSSEGLLLTNHHCVVDCAQNLSDAAHDYVKDGFLADDRDKERKCPGQQAEILMSITDVTPQVKAAIGATGGETLIKSRDAAIARIESAGCPDKAKQRCQVVTLYGGGQYKLYSYRKYSDVRLVFAPEYRAAQFGGDPDNFNYPRYGLDASFLRLYEDGKPVSTPTHLRWNPRAPKPGELVFVAGNPGTTSRLFTQSQMANRRDLVLPSTEILLSELRGRLTALMADDPEKARTGEDSLFGIENSFKAYYGMYRSLLDPAFAAKLADAEKDHGRVALGDVIDTGLFDHERAEEHPLWAKELFGYADHRPESEEYGIESFVYRARAPFDPVKFYDFATRSWPGVVRAKGHFWLATQPDYMGELAQAGAQTMTSRLGRWWAAVPSERWPSGDAFDVWVKPKWDPVWGDRRQELVFIGIGMDEARLRADLDACLVDASSFTPDRWHDMADPFPAWGPAEMQAA